MKCLDQALPYLTDLLSSIDKAAANVGLPIVKDSNDPKAPAMGLYRLDIAIDGHAQRRTSYHSFLNTNIALARESHLAVCTGAITTRLDVDIRAGLVRGVHFRSAEKSSRTNTPSRDFYVSAKREVIVSCGAFKTPQILMLSGIGPREQLDAHGVPVIRELTWVGQSLADHYAFPIMLELPKKETLHLLEVPLIGLWHIILWFFFGTGLMSHGSNTSTIFARSSAIDDKTMNIQARSVDNDANNLDISKPQNAPDIEVMIMAVNSFKRHVPGRTLFTLYPCIGQPFSKGMVELRDGDPLSHPRVTHPMFRDKRDWPSL